MKTVPILVCLLLGAAEASAASLTVGDYFSATQVEAFVRSPDGKFAGILKTPPPSTHVGVIKVDPSALKAAEVELSLPDGKKARYLTTSLRYPEGQETSKPALWEGRWADEIIDGVPRQLGRLFIAPSVGTKVPVNGSHIGGHLTLEGETYEVISLSDHVAAIIKYDRRASPNRHPSDWDEFQRRQRDNSATGTPSTVLGTFVDASSEKSLLSPTKLTQLETMRSERSVKTARLIKLDPRLQTALSILATVKEDLTLTLMKKTEIRRGPGDLSWIGTVNDGGEAVLVFKDEVVSGVIHARGERVFVILHLQPGLHVLQEIDRNALPPAHSAPPASKG